jgi:hypothetical protein
LVRYFGVLSSAPSSGRRSRGCVQAATRYIPWAELLKRVRDIDALSCSECGGRLRMISLILQKDVVRRILLSLGLPCEPPVIARACAPTLFDDSPPPDYDAAGPAGRFVRVAGAGRAQVDLSICTF